MHAGVILLLMPTLHCTPFPLNAHAKRVLQLWSNGSDVDAALIEMRREATEHGLTGDEYLRVCTEQCFVMTEFEEKQWLRDDSIESHYDIFHNLNSSNEVMGILREHAPRKFVIILGFVALFEKNVQHIDTASEKFLRNIAQSYLELMVKTSKPPATLLWKEWINAFGEVRSNYSALPRASKDALEKTFCFKTTLSKIYQLENNVKELFAQFTLLEQILGKDNQSFNNQSFVTSRI